MLGTAVTGDPTNDAFEWCLDFSTSDYDKFLFASGDWDIWLLALKTEVGPGVTYDTDSPRNVINSSSSSTAYTSNWKNKWE